jgi:hypothetical protein
MNSFLLIIWIPFPDFHLLFILFLLLTVTYLDFINITGLQVSNHHRHAQIKYRTIPSTLRSKVRACLVHLVYLVPLSVGIFDRPALNRRDYKYYQLGLGSHLRHHPSHYKTVLRGTAQPGGMHPLCLLPALSLLLGARASFLDSRGSVHHRLDMRDTPDVCATVNYNFSGIGEIGEI